MQFARRTLIQIEGVAYGDRLEVAGEPALVTGLLRDCAEVASLGPRELAPGGEVRRIGPLEVPTGDDLVGRTIDGLGRALDAGPPVAEVHLAPIFARAPSVVAARPGARLSLGAMVYDLQRLVASGTSMLAWGPNEVLLHLLRHQVASDRVVVVATLDRGAATRFEACRADLRCVHVVADESPAQQWLVPMTAVAIGEGLRARGRDAVVVIDALEAWRPSVGQFPERGSWDAQLEQLASRAYATENGSLSIIGSTRAARAMGGAAFHECLDLGLALRGEVPATGTKMARPPIRNPCGARLGRVILAAGASLEALEASVALGRTVHPSAREDIADGRLLREFLRYRPGAPVDSVEQLLVVLAALFACEEPRLAAERVGSFLDTFLTTVRTHEAARLQAARAAERLTEEDVSAFLAWAGRALSVLESPVSSIP